MSCKQIFWMFYAGLVIECLAADQPSAVLSVGNVTGLFDYVSDDQTQYTIKKFLGIPYAKPPVGNLRLRRPEPLENLASNPYNATYQRPFCIQATSDPNSDPFEDEDCLYLNLYVPTTAADQPSGHAVMIWVYGGSFVSGASNLYDGSLLAAVGNVIVVTLNYRLGFFGFFSTMDSASPGNFGLYDQAIAFQWVHDNIGEFGGSNSRVTIFGESAGAMSVNMHSLYPSNLDLFQRVLTQSGAVTSPYLALDRGVSKKFATLGEVMNCQTDDTSVLTDCLRQKPYRNIKSALVQLDEEHPNWQTSFFLPIADGDIAQIDYSHAYQNSSAVQFFRSLDFLAGRNLYDGAEELVYLAHVIPDVNNWRPTQDEMIHTYINALNESGIKGFPVPERIARTILHEYTDWSDPEHYESIRLRYVKLLTDVIFGAPAAEILKLHEANMSDAGATYAYVFMPVTTSRPPWTPVWLPGADHAEEIRSVFGSYFEYMAEWEKELSLRMMVYWSNFAKSG